MRSPLFPLIAAAVLVGFAGAGVARADEHPPAWSEPTRPFRIAGNVYYVGTAGLASYLVTTPNGHVLIDGTLPENAKLIARNVRSLGFRLGDIRYILINHAHWDHAGGLAELKRLSGAQLVASAGDRPALESGHVSYRSTTAWPAAHVDRVIRDGERLRLGGTSFVAHLTPGHTKGCTSWTTRITEAKRPLTVLFACSITVAGQPLTGNPGYPSAAADFRRSFDKLARLHADIFLGFHTEMFGLPEKRRKLESGDRLAFVDPEELPRQVAGARRAFDRELASERHAALEEKGKARRAPGAQ